MFNLRSPDGGLIYSDTHMSNFFGWKLKKVSERRQQYDLTDYDDLKQIVFAQNKTPIEDYDIIKSQHKHLNEKLNKKVTELAGALQISEDGKNFLHKDIEKMKEKYDNDIQELKNLSLLFFKTISVITDETILEVLKTKYPKEIYTDICEIAKQYTNRLKTE